MDDRVLRRRHKNGSIQPTVEQIIAIRTEHVPYKVTFKILSVKYGFSMTTISDIVNRKRHKNI